MARSHYDISIGMVLACFACMLVAFILSLYFLISITSIEKRGVYKLTPHYFETYNHCKQEGVSYE